MKSRVSFFSFRLENSRINDDLKFISLVTIRFFEHIFPFVRFVLINFDVHEAAPILLIGNVGI